VAGRSRLKIPKLSKWLPLKRFVATGEFATDDGGAQLSLGEIMGGVHFRIVQKGQPVGLLLGQTLPNLFRLLSLEGVWRSRLS